jgi:adenylate cyclase
LLHEGIHEIRAAKDRKLSEQNSNLGAPVPRASAAAPYGTGHRFPIRLRPTLLFAIVGLVLLSTVAVGVCATWLTLRSTRALMNLTEKAAVSTATDEIQNFFKPVPEITADLSADAHSGLLPMGDPHLLARQLADRLRVREQILWIGYGDARSGNYVGANRRPDGEIIEYVADPAVNGAVPKQIGVAEDGTESQPKIVETAPYRVATRSWFRDGITKRGISWTPFYKMFSEGYGYGITCTAPFTQRGAVTPQGVFHVDLSLKSVTRFLSDIRIGDHGAVFLIDRRGHRVASPEGRHVPAAALAVDSVAATGASLESPLRLQNGKYEILFSPITERGDLGLRLAVVVDQDDVTAGIYREGLIAGGVALGFTLLAMLVGIMLSARISKPVTIITNDLARVGSFDISRDPSPTSFVREIAELGISVDRMKAGLRSFGHYVPTDLVRTLLAEGIDARLGGELRNLTIHFSDVENFTAISEGMQPTALVEAMGRYFELMTGAIARAGGTVDKFMGDGIMAFFNAPAELPGHERQACLAALEAQQMLAEMARNTPPGRPVLRARIGLGVGEVLVGNIGTPERFAYTVLGDEVNLASRLESLNKAYGTRIMASEALMEKAGDDFEWRRLDRVAVKGRQQGTIVCELIGRKGAIPTAMLDARADYESALDAYFAGDFAQAAQLFAEAARQRPDDLAATMMSARCRALAAAPPAAWDGIHVMHEK